MFDYTSVTCASLQEDRNELASLSSKISCVAQVLELADKQDLGSCAFGREGSTPSLGTTSRFRGCSHREIVDHRSRSWNI